MRLTIKRILFNIGAFVLIALACFSLYIWLTFGTPRIDEIYWVFYAPLGNIDLQFLLPVLKFFLLPLSLLSVLYVFLHKKYPRFLGIFLCCVAGITGAFLYSINKKSNILLHLSSSSFIEELQGPENCQS